MISFGQICARFPAHYPHLSLVDGLDHESIKTLFFNSIFFWGDGPYLSPNNLAHQATHCCCKRLATSTVKYRPFSSKVKWKDAMEHLNSSAVAAAATVLEKKSRTGPQNTGSERECMSETITCDMAISSHCAGTASTALERHRQLNFPWPSRIPRRR